MRVVLCQTKNGLPSFLALSMKREVEDLRNSSSTVSMFSLTPSHRMRRQRAVILNLLLADLAPARHLGGVVLVRCPGVQHVARAVLRTEGGVFGVGGPVRVRQGVEVVQIAVEFIEAVQASADTCSSRRGDSCRTGRWRNPCDLSAVAIVHGLVRHADIGAGLSHSCQARAERNFAGDEGGSTGRAARLGVVVGK